MEEVIILKNKGFTLIEIILTLAIIGIISIPIFTIFNNALTNIVRAGKRTEAIEIAKVDLEIDPDKTSIEGGVNVSIEMESGSDTVVNVNVDMIEGLHVLNQGSKNELSVEIISYIPY